MTFPVSRRQALVASSLIAADLSLFPEQVVRAEEASTQKLNIAVIGLGGQGKSNLNGVSKENIVALCDVDDLRCGDAYERFPKAKKFYDFRKMFDEMEKQIDAVVISTPDHTHFHPAKMAIERGKHVYLEKPMAHSVWEVRELTELARKKKVATQLGVQRHTLKSIHEAVEIVRTGVLGHVSKVYSWVGGERGMPAIPKEFGPAPDSLKWDLWLGPAAEKALFEGVCSLQLAFLVGLWYWRNRQLGMPHLRYSFLGLELVRSGSSQCKWPGSGSATNAEIDANHLAVPCSGRSPSRYTALVAWIPAILKELGLEKAKGTICLSVRKEC